MKKSICLLMMGVLLLCCVSCGRKQVLSADVRINLPMTTAIANTSVYLEPDSEQSAFYNETIATYNAFLSGEAVAQAKSGENFTIQQYGLTGEGVSAFALSDVNNDNVPELLVHGHLFHVFAFDGIQLVEWYQSQNIQPIYLLKNGAIWHIRSSTAYHYNYVTFDADGIAENVSFSQPFEGDPSPTYYFWGLKISGEVSKADWEVLTRPYFEQAQNMVEINWIEWK